MRYFLPVAVIGCAAVASWLGAVEPVRRPQLASGGDALSVAFGGAKRAIGVAMMQKADSYFHGGVDMECHDHGGDCGHPHEESGFDPWAWINRHIRAPEIDRHLQDSQTVELMPWFWVAVKADPSNIDAWTTAAYMADHGMRDHRLALEVIDRGIAANPADAELRFYKGKLLYDAGRGDAEAARAEFLEAERLALDGRGESSLSEDEARQLRFIRQFLEKIGRVKK